MFSRSAYPTVRNANFNAYRQVAARTAVDGASPHLLVTLLLDALMAELACARGALARGDVAEKCLAIVHAVRIVEEGLKGPLDLQAGGTLAESRSIMLDNQAIMPDNQAIEGGTSCLAFSTRTPGCTASLPKS